MLSLKINREGVIVKYKCKEGINMKDRSFLYILNYPPEEKKLCNLEMKSLLNEENTYKYVFSKKDIDESRSPYVKQKIEVICEDENLEALYSKIKDENISSENYKVEYIKVEDKDLPFKKSSYEDRLRALKEIGMRITGVFTIDKPTNLFGLTYLEDRWIFGRLFKNDFKWHEHDNKPNSYSNALGLKTSRALINIAVGTNKDLKVVDPCCGIGTVVLEGLSMGINIKGFEILPHIAEKANENLRSFGYDEVIKCFDMHKVLESFDVCILDLPYGLFTTATEKEQIDLIKSCKTLAKKLLLVSFDEKDKDLIKLGYKITNKCTQTKNRFTRHIYVCEI